MSRVGSRERTILRATGERSVADLLWVANTRHGPAGHWFARVSEDAPDHDHLADAEDAVWYLGDHEVTVPSSAPRPADLAELAVLRELVRGLHGDAPEWPEAAARLLDRARFRLRPDGSFRSARTGWAGFIEDLLVPALEVVRDRERLRICGNPLCRLVFLDASKSGSRRWCDDAGCGNRDRVKRHRRGVAA